MLILPAIALLVPLAGGTWLDVPFVRQAKQDCGPATIWMVMQYWKPSGTPSVADIHHAVFSADDSGTRASDIDRYLTANGFQTWTIAGRWDDLRENLMKGRPLIVAMKGSPLHYVVVAGMDETQDLLFVNDPASKKLRAMHRADFERRWLLTQNWTLLALPTEKPRTEENSPGFKSSPPSPASPNASLAAASEAFRQENYREAKRLATQAAQAEPSNSTTDDLLATLYLLDGNVEAALKYWNRIGQPAIQNIDVATPLKVDPVVLDDTLEFSRKSVLSLSDYLKTKRRLDETQFVSNYTFDFSPVDNDRFDMTLRAYDASGAHYLGWLRGLPYQTVRPQFTNISGHTLNFDSLVRWDPNKRRVTARLEGPLPTDDSIRYAISVDARDEQWSLCGDRFSLTRVDTIATVQSLIGSRGTWSTGLTAGTRRVGYLGSLDYDLARWPERRLVVSAGIRSEIGRDRTLRFAKAESSIRLHWLPQARGSDFETSIQIRAGRASADTPVDALFILGLDRDSDLLLRAHRTLSAGRKGLGPIGDQYVLINFETDKILHDFGIARISAGPFIDVARMSNVFVDSGVVLRLSAGPSLSFSFSLARDLRSNHTVGFLN